MEIGPAKLTAVNDHELERTGPPANYEIIRDQQQNYQFLIDNLSKDPNEPAYYRLYMRARSFLYESLVKNAVADSDFSRMIDFSLSSEDPYFPRRLYRDLTSEEKKRPPFDVTDKETSDDWHREAAKFNSRRVKIFSSFEEFVAKDSEGLFESEEVAWRNSFLKRLLHTVRVRKVQRFISENYFEPLLEAGKTESVEYTALEEAKKLAENSKAS